MAYALMASQLYGQIKYYASLYFFSNHRPALWTSPLPSLAVKDNTYHNCATLSGHQGPVWQVAWAHPKFGVLLASCSYDGSVIIFRESPQNQWAKVYEHKFHDASVNSISWAPAEFGLILAWLIKQARHETTKPAAVLSE